MEQRAAAVGMDGDEETLDINWFDGCNRTPQDNTRCDAASMLPGYS